ncbi:MAG: acetamidase/formamidase family protein [Candidatus Bathyarchaeota archaeon]|nr:acetamidase/formamidase family protein [Candidatus Bathyarchaeota archaeon]
MRVERKPREEITAFDNSTLNPVTKPVAYVKPGDIVEVTTWDAYGGVVDPETTFQQAIEKGIVGSLNPVTGPIHVEGAEPGDTLVVEIIDIELPEWGGSSIIPGFGALEGWVNLMEPRTKISYIRDNKVIYETDHGETIEIPVEPFIGTIGVSPAYEAIQTLAPGAHGGNMDCPDVRAGNKLYLPVGVPGALFGLGDVHAVQGDGEICGTAVEISAVVKLRFSVEKKTIAWPRIESDTEIMTVCSARPLEDAAKLAYREMVNLMVTEYGWDRDDAYMFLSLAVKARIAQIVDPLYTVVAKLDKKYLTKR